MEEEKKWAEAGRIAAKARTFALKKVKQGISLLEATRQIEERIKQLGGDLAFPVQISLNETAAHYCATINDKTILQEHVVKVDIGVHVDGFIGDTAVTIDLSKRHQRMIKAVESALQRALKKVRAGLAVSELGKVIHEAIAEKGLSPIRNLGGHGIKRFEIHAAPSIPNYDNNDRTVLEEGMVIAIEPFATDGAGIVYEGSPATIFSLVEAKPVRLDFIRQIQQDMAQYKGLPFAQRWLEEKYGVAKTRFALSQLLRLGAIKSHPPLIDRNKGIVAQAEHTVLVAKKPVILTSEE